MQLTLVQKTLLDGAVIVSTLQEVALADARRAHRLFEKVNVPTLGLIENMSGDVFGRGGGAAEAGRLGIPASATCRSTPPCAKAVTPACRSW